MVKVEFKERMPIEKIKKKLEKQLPKFTFTTGEEAGQPEANWHSISAQRDGLALAMDVSRVTDSGDVKSLVRYISKQWEGRNNGK